MTSVATQEGFVGSCDTDRPVSSQTLFRTVTDDPTSLVPGLQDPASGEDGTGRSDSWWHLRGGLRAVLVRVPPNRRAQDAIAEIHHYTTTSYQWVLEADVEACFDNIDHAALMDRLRHRTDDQRRPGPGEVLPRGPGS